MQRGLVEVNGTYSPYIRSQKFSQERKENETGHKQTEVATSTQQRKARVY
jgi:hypothetical protein